MAGELNYLPAVETVRLMEVVAEVDRMLKALIRSLEAKEST